MDFKAGSKRLFFKVSQVKYLYFQKCILEINDIHGVSDDMSIAEVKCLNQKESRGYFKIHTCVWHKAKLPLKSKDGPILESVTVQQLFI